jgi:Tfp pilus assembly protein PilO
VSGCLALTLLLVGANFFLRSAHASAVQRHAEIREQGEQLLRTLANRPHIEADLAALRAANAQIAGNLMDEQSMEVNLGYFYRLEKASRVRLVRLNQLAALAPLPGSLYKTVQFSMQVKGSYRNNVNFLRALETGPRILRIRNSSVERSTPDNGELLMELTVEMLAKP